MFGGMQDTGNIEGRIQDENILAGSGYNFKWQFQQQGFKQQVTF